MSIAALIRRMAEAGASAEAIAIAVEAIEAAHAEADTRRAHDAERKRRQRAGQSRDSHGTVTGPSTDGHATSPVPSVSPTPPSTTLYPLPSEPKGSSEKTTRARKGPPPAKSRRCPNAWMPSETDVAMAKREGFTPGEIDRELAKIRDYEFRDGHSDWDAVFRNWIRKAAERKAPQPRVTHERPHPTSAKLDAKQANMDRAVRGAEIALARRAL